MQTSMHGVKKSDSKILSQRIKTNKKERRLYMEKMEPECRESNATFSMTDTTGPSLRKIQGSPFSA